MKINHLVLGAAGVLAATSAQAADLPVAPAPEPIDYVRICDAYGSGFFFIPGTETCMKIDGYVRYQMSINDSDNDRHGQMEGSYGRQSSSPFQQAVTGRVNFDVIENTAWGTLRGYIRLEVSYSSETDNNGDASLPSNVGAGSTFIQIGDGILLGRNTSNFDFFAGYVAGTTVVGADAGTLQAAYTASFGNGLFATLAIEENQARVHTLTLDPTGAAINTVLPTNIDSGNRYPDIVGNIAYEQGIFSAQVSGAVHWVEGANDLAGAVITDEVGFAVQGGVELNLPFMAGVTLALQGGYAYGAPDYICALCIEANTPDGIVDNNGNIELSSGYSIAGGIVAAFTDDLSFEAQAGFAEFDMGPFNSSVTTAAAGLTWTPVNNLVIRPAVIMEHQTTNARALADDPWGFTGLLRLQRNF